jgi:hypothetical protein
MLRIERALGDHFNFVMRYRMGEKDKENVKLSL